MEEITGKIKISSLRFTEIQKEIKNISKFADEIQKSSVEKVTNLLEIVLGGAILLRASDLHIEPGEKETRIRIRIDGILQDATVINRQVYEALLSRIKLLAGIKLNISDHPQDGRFSILLSLPQGKETSIEIRTSTLPAKEGESVVLRILNPQSLVEIEALGLRKDLLAIFLKEIKKPNGMIIVTGPTGSGKTTTLYSFLKKIQKPEIKIITIEDPIEYYLKGVSQTQVAPDKKYDFATGLKSIMRQDPDVILVGEVRDSETVKIALQAALTGHLVFTTLHTNDAAGTIARLTSLGANTSNIAPAINLAIAQRLVRKVCKKCTRLQKINAKDLEKLKKGLQSIPKTIKIPQLTPNLKIPQIKGCSACNFTGYQGRIGIYEALLIDDKIEKFMLTNPSITALRERAIKNGMVLAKQDGLIKVLEGITTIEEIEKIMGE